VLGAAVQWADSHDPKPDDHLPVNKLRPLGSPHQFRILSEVIKFGADGEPPVEWVGRETGHRVIRLSREPGSASLYFHQNAYTASGDKLVVTTPKGVSTLNSKQARSN
jgi:hypothetical protein